MRFFAVVCGLAIGTSAAAAAAAAGLSIAPARDNTLFESADGELSDGAGPALFAGNTGQGLARRALLFFDVASRVPAGARVDSVVLTLQVSNAPNSIPRQITVHRLLADWGEGASVAAGGGGVASTEGDATWVHTYYPSQTWSTPGGEFDPAISASLLVEGVGAYAWSGSVLTTDVQSWLTQPGSNHGWLVLGEETGLNTARRFESREAAEPSTRPALTIYYTGTIASRSTTSWGSIKVLYR
jgi:hypothetical protein